MVILVIVGSAEKIRVKFRHQIDVNVVYCPKNGLRELLNYLSVCALKPGAAALLSILLLNYLILNIDSIMLAKNIRQKDLFIQSAQKVFPTIALFILEILLICVGLLLLIIPGIYLSFRIILAYPVLLLENKGIIDSLKYSYKVSKNSWWFLAVASTIMQISVLIPVLLLLIISMLTIVYTGVEDKTFSPYIIAIVTSFFQILGACNILAVYYVMLWRVKAEQATGILND